MVEITVRDLHNQVEKYEVETVTQVRRKGEIVELSTIHWNHDGKWYPVERVEGEVFFTMIE